MYQRFARKGLTGVSVLCVGILSGCGGQEEEAAVNVSPPTETQAAPAKANNPLAKQQSAMKDAAAVQGMLDKNSDEKKKALEEAMN